ncbi:hypothetical protein BFW01_g12647 [Lasiodiplodia theobromae]|nr:hypothetical protein BFW01_g12647 [Lasiodiplodia theobromae]
MPPQPTCETDSSSDEGIARSKSRSRSNVSAKRTSQSELDRNHHAARPMDLTSDSGYSSRTAATGSSADSAKSPNHRRRSPVKPQAPPAVPDAPAMAPAPAQTRPRQPESLKKKTATARESPKSSKTSTKHKDKRPVLVQKSSTQGRTASVSRRRDSMRQDCDDPDCRECLARPKPKLPPLVTGMKDEYSTQASIRLPPSIH